MMSDARKCYCLVGFLRGLRPFTYKRSQVRVLLSPPKPAVFGGFFRGTYSPLRRRSAAPAAEPVTRHTRCSALCEQARAPLTVLWTERVLLSPPKTKDTKQGVLCFCRIAGNAPPRFSARGALVCALRKLGGCNRILPFRFF